MVINLPAIIEWLNYGYDIFISKLPALNLADGVNFRQLAAKAESSRYYEYFVIFVLAFLVGISAYLWREFKEIVN